MKWFCSLWIAILALALFSGCNGAGIDVDLPDGTSSTDAGSDPTDAGTDPTDAGSDPTEDGGSNVLPDENTDGGSHADVDGNGGVDGGGEGGGDAACSKDELKAFPCAEGFGRLSEGGRGGDVILVTNLDDSGSGSLRACIEASGARTCVFRVAGTITVSSSIKVSDPNLTVAGQSAPGDGINIKSNAGKTVLKIEADDVVIRHIRIRVGPGGDSDAINILGGANNVIIDHVSTSWATDETISATGGSQNVTIQRSIVAEALDCSTHSEGCHGYGSLIATGNVSVHHNVYAHLHARAPQVSAEGTVDVVNNVVYNVASQGDKGPWAPSHVKYPESIANYVNNIMLAGESTRTDYYVSADESAKVYLSGNQVPGSSTLRPGDEAAIVDSRNPAPEVTTLLISEVLDNVLANSGANQRVNCDGTFTVRRDAVDLRILDDVRNGTGMVIDSESEVGGWPTLSSGPACADGDDDGMPDEWESVHGFDPGDGSDGNDDANGDGYTNLEEYLNGTNPR